MKLDVTQAIRTPGTVFPFTAEQAIAPQEILGEVMTFDPVRLEGSYEAQEDGTVTVTGQLETVVHARCANCLAPVSERVSAEYQEDFLLNGDPEDDEIFSYTGGLVDLEKLTLTCVLLNMPMRFVCKSGCRGMAAYTEQDDQISLCQKELPGQRPFAALQQLLEQNTGSDAD